MQLQFPDLPTDTAVATVLYDATRVGPQSQEEMEARWRTLSSQLAEQGAGTELLEVLSQRVLENTGAPGRHGRLLVATPNNIAVDRLLTEPPALDSAVLGRGVDVLALAWQADDQVRALLVEVDRSGADLSILDTSIAAERSAEDSVTADQNELTKNREGGLSHRRIHARAEDSWERNATQIAEEIDNRVREQRPELVLLAGDVRMVSLVQEAVSEHVGRILHVLESGSRAEGVHEEAFAEELREVSGQFRLRRREEILERYNEQAGQDGAAVVGVGDVLDALRRGQVEELLVAESALNTDSALRTTPVWIGPEAAQAAMRRENVIGLGVDAPEEVSADRALGRLVLATDAGVTLIDEAALDVPDQVAALLRWHDDATPGQSTLSMSGDTERT
ncbi:MAG TPA: Vms1/Ankzf1 family peptidyl-tRNA hydrolase [Beutenbergiaceae bacterium]|nr:Vms1/Ankzf1 family peptidyl-tRNA hydrolase [Beutenbergiaceae bacterium]